MPYIEDDGQKIGDSNLVIEYLKEKYGDRPIILDATAHATIANLIKVPMNSPLKTKATELANLVSFSDQMTSKFYPS